MNDCFIHNTKFESHFTITSNKIPEDNRLSWGAKGLLWYILSRPPGWRIRISQLAKIHKGEGIGSGEHSTRRFINELRKLKYIIYTRKQSARGHWVHSYHVYPMPFPDYQKMFPEGDFPHAESHNIVVSTDLVRTKEEKEQQQERFELKEILKNGTEKYVVVVPLFLKDIPGLKESSARKLMKLYEIGQLEAAASLLIKSKTHIRSPFGWLRRCIEEDYESAPTREELSRDNRKILRDSFGQLDGKVIGGQKITVGPSYIEFLVGGAQNKVITFRIDEPAFEVGVRSYIKRLQNRNREP